jgi:hypothetical protein
VSSHPDRDRSTDALLRAALPGLTAMETSACLDAEALAAWSERALSSADAARVDAHLAGCARCQALLAAFVRTEPQAAAALPLWQRWPALKWLIPTAALAGTVVIVAVITRETREASLERVPVQQMARQELPSAASPLPARDAAPPPPAEVSGSPASPAPRGRQERAATAEPARNDALRRTAEQTAGSRDRADSAAGTSELRQSAAPATTVAPAVPPPPPSRQNLTDGAANVPLSTLQDAQTRPAVTVDAEKTSTELDSVQVTNLPLNQYRNYQALVVLVPGPNQYVAAAETIPLDKVVAEIVSAPRPAFAAAGESRAGRGRGGAARAAQSAAEATTLANTVAARWRILATGIVERSTNGGATWHPVTVDTRVAVTGGVSPSDLVCWLIGPGGTVVLSTDGQTLRRVAFPETADLVSVTADNDRSATVMTADGRTFVTFDGGATWTRRQP